MSFHNPNYQNELTESDFPFYQDGQQFDPNIFLTNSNESLDKDDFIDKEDKNMYFQSRKESQINKDLEKKDINLINMFEVNEDQKNIKKDIVTENKTKKTKETTKTFGRKKKSEDNKSDTDIHGKYSQDNMMRKIKTN